MLWIYGPHLPTRVNKILKKRKFNQRLPWNSNHRLHKRGTLPIYLALSPKWGQKLATCKSCVT